MKRCIKCAMPDTRPGAIFDGDVCQACLNYEKRKTIDWAKRGEELIRLCARYRREDGYYDCLIPVSGGKDSHFLVYTMKVELGMNPLLITIGDPFTKTEVGKHNLKNLGDIFNCDHILFNLSDDLLRRVMWIGFEELGHPFQLLETAIYTVPPKMAVKLGIPLVVYGENSAYEYGTTDSETHSALDNILEILWSVDTDFWLRRGISHKEMNAVTFSLEEELEIVKLTPIFMSYFCPWSSTEHLALAKAYGFRDLANEWEREGYIENFEQIEMVAFPIHFWLKYPKFGFQRVSDIASRRVREGLLGLSEAKRLIAEHDHKLDQRSVRDFIDFLGYTPKQFWDIVEKFWNPEIFEKVGGVWKEK